jgi:hypothetical protein
VSNKRHGWLQKSLSVGLGLLAASFAWAEPTELSNGTLSEPNPEQISEYYSFSEVTSPPRKASWSTPDELWMEVQSDFEESAVGKTVSLLNWVRHNGAPPEATVPYNRKRHFGTWTDDPQDNDCFNTRAEVLIRESHRKVSYSPKNPCIVDRGLWKDPYTGNLFESSRQIQIDHIVPLKNAYISGAWKWTPAKRCTYANFMANSYHLLAVSGSENSKKGDRGPDQYMPPEESFACEYLEDWLKVKMIWGLIMLPEEVQAVRKHIHAQHCRLSDLTISRQELEEMRESMHDEGPCANFHGDIPKPKLEP